MELRHSTVDQSQIVFKLLRNKTKKKSPVKWVNGQYLRLLFLRPESVMNRVELDKLPGGKYVPRNHGKKH